MEIFANLVGVTFRPVEAKAIVRSLTPADGNQLHLEADPTNEYDDHAVKVLFTDGTHLGFVARENNHDVFEALQRGDELQVEIVGFENTLKPTLLIRDFDVETEAQV